RALKLDERQRKVRIPSVGTVPLRKGRAIPDYGRAFVVTKNGRWYAVFECEREPVPQPPTGKLVGMDRGIRSLLVLSDGTHIGNPKQVERRRGAVERHQRELEMRTERDASRRVRNRQDPRRQAAVLRLARANEREKNARRDFLHKCSRTLVLEHDAIIIEALRVRNMLRSARGTLESPGRGVKSKSGLNRAIADAGWGMLVTLMREKAEYAVRTIVEVPAKNTSRTCAECGNVAKGNRKGAVFACVRCGHREDADVNAARVILARAQSALATSALPPGNTRLNQHDAV
ncbi:MAG: transposase, partial [Candidatus Eremiobacteraeota bacterium]|nr:transposase [Candidatus Eremiobacteraeota bacterium]